MYNIYSHLHSYTHTFFAIFKFYMMMSLIISRNDFLISLDISRQIFVLTKICETYITSSGTIPPFSLSVQTGKLQSLFATIKVRSNFCNESRSCFHYGKKSLSNPRSSFACRRGNEFSNALAPMGQST